MTFLTIFVAMSNVCIARAFFYKPVFIHFLKQRTKVIIKNIHYFEYFVKRDVDKFFITIAIRNLGVGMVLIFEPIYLYLYFNKELSPTLFYHAALFGLYGLFAVLAAKLLARFGPHRIILASYLFLMAYYVVLFLFAKSFLFVPLAVLVGAISMALFWLAFHVDFVRFSSGKDRGKQISKAGIATILPMVAAPFIGGWILAGFGYPVLFIVVLAVLLASAIPLIYTKETYEVYTDSYDIVLRKIFSKERWRTTLAFVSFGMEISISAFIWPLFMFIGAIGFTAIGGITSAALLGSGLFILYVGKLSDTAERPWLLNLGAISTSVAWIVKSFVNTPFDALLSHFIYRVARGAASIPFQTFFYEKAADSRGMADEFIVYRTVIIALSRFLFFSVLAIIFLVFPDMSLKYVFFVGAVTALGLMLLQSRSKITA